MMGAERRSMVMDEEEKTLTAFHEAGHAVVGLFMPYTRNQEELDKLDFRLLNLDANGVSKSDWLDDHLSQAANGDVTIDIGNLTVRLVDHNDLGDGFLAQVEDGIFL